MAGELTRLSPPAGSTTKRTRVGRGEGSGLGKTSGRGTKGQNARHGVRRGFEGGQMPLYRRLPIRGFTNIFKTEYVEIQLSAIAESFEAGSVVDLDALKASGLLRGSTKGPLKVLGGCDIDRKLTVKAEKFTASAKGAIEAAGGIAEQIGV